MTMTGFEPRISSVGSDHSANCAITIWVRDERELSSLFLCWHPIQLVFLPHLIPLRGSRVVYCCFVTLLSMSMAPPFLILRWELSSLKIHFPKYLRVNIEGKNIQCGYGKGHGNGTVAISLALHLGNTSSTPTKQQTFFTQMGPPRPLFRLFLVFSNKQYIFYNKSILKISCPYSLQTHDFSSMSRLP